MSKFKDLIFTGLFAVVIFLISGCSTMNSNGNSGEKLSPKVVIVTAFGDPKDLKEVSESALWYNDQKLYETLEIPGGYSPLYYNNQGVGLVITGMGKSNAASTIMALGLSKDLDLTNTVFIIAGIAGMNPQKGSIGSVVFVRRVIDIDTKYQIHSNSIEELSKDYPMSLSDEKEKSWIDRVSKFAMNNKLLEHCFELSKNVKLKDSSDVMKFARKYKEYPKAVEKPQILIGDNVTSDTFWHGKIYSEKVDKWIKQVTDNDSEYMVTEMEDSALLSAFVRLDKDRKIDFNRILILRSASNFDREPTGVTPTIDSFHFSPGYFLATDNVYIVASSIANNILKNWNAFNQQLK